MGEKIKKIIGSTFKFRQYMCSRCQKMFFIEEKQNLSGVEAFNEFNKTYRSPCCEPYTNPITKKVSEPHGIYIRTLTLRVEGIPDEIALVHKRRVAAENGKSDPYQDKNGENEEDDN